jgi:hypothetical protein
MVLAGEGENPLLVITWGFERQVEMTFSARREHMAPGSWRGQRYTVGMTLQAPEGQGRY